MEQAESTLMAERHQLEEALKANSANPATLIKAAQLEARLWAEEPGSADLPRLAKHLDDALVHLPPEHRPSVVKFAADLQRRGADIVGLLKTGNYPRLTALLTKRPAAPAATQPATAPTKPAKSEPPQPSPAPEPITPAPAPAGAKQAPPEPPEAAQPAPKPRPRPAPSQSASGSAATTFKEINVGEVTNAKIKVWMSEDALAELTSAFPLIDNFRIRRMIIDKVSLTSSSLSLACLLNMITHEDDAKTILYIAKKITGLDADLLARELKYDRNDRKHAMAVVRVLSKVGSKRGETSLEAAMSDPDEEIRVLAVDGLRSLRGSSKEWVKELADIVRHDQAPAVKHAAAHALQSLDSVEAFEALSAASKEEKFDHTLMIVLNSMDEQFMSARKDGARARQKKEKEDLEADKKSGKGDSNPIAKIMIVIVIIAVLAGAGYMVYLQMR